MAQPVTRGLGQRWLVLAALLTIVLVIGGFGALVTTPRIPIWYAGLNKPPFSPPNWLFGPVWTILYIVMAVAAWRVWLVPATPQRRRDALIWFAVQLALNAGWSPVFFGLGQPAAAFFVIVLLLAAIVLTTRKFLAIDRVAGLMMFPYLAWVAFATVLNGAIVMLN